MINRFVAILLVFVFGTVSISIGETQAGVYAMGQSGNASPTPISSTSFTDLSSDFWAYPAIQSLVQAGVIEGYPDGSFQPDKSVSRAEFAIMVVVALNLSFVLVEYPTFPDVPGNHWALTYVETAMANHLVEGYPDSSFRPEGEITLAEILTVIIRAKGWSLVDPPTPPPRILVEEANGRIRFLDSSDWFYQTGGTAVTHGLLTFPEDTQIVWPGTNSGESKIRFNSPASRAQTAVLLQRMLK